jgi:thiol-disulfide isomerase/thioredoxin
MVSVASLFLDDCEFGMRQRGSHLRWLAIGLILSVAACNSPAPPAKPPATTSSTPGSTQHNEPGSATPITEPQLGAPTPTGEIGSATSTPPNPKTPTDSKTPSDSKTPTHPNTPPQAPAASGGTGESGAAKAIELREMNWEQLQELVASHKGKVVVVDIWSTSCEPCLREFPHLVKMQQRHPDDVVCISFDCDYIGVKKKPVAYYRERVLKSLEGHGAGGIINVISTLAADELFEKIDVDSIPAVYVYDRTGKLSKRFDNRTPAGGDDEGISYEKQIDPLVAELVKAAQN